MFNIQIHEATAIKHRLVEETQVDVFVISTKSQGDITIAVYPLKEKKEAQPSPMTAA